MRGAQGETVRAGAARRPCSRGIIVRTSRSVLWLAPAALGAWLAIAAPASASTTIFALSDHPDGNAAPATYGLRLDGLFAGRMGAGAGITTFSFNHFNDVRLTVHENMGTITLNIAGTIWGGEKSGADYAYGKGAYALNFDFTMHVAASGTGWVVNQDDPVNNTGRVTALGNNAGVPMGTVFPFHDMSAASFLFLQDEHRLAGHPQAGHGYWVGRGWVTFQPNGGDSAATQDWLFLGTPVPLPAGGALACAGLVGLAGRRRRRPRCVAR